MCKHEEQKRRLVADVPESVHKELKQICVFKNIAMQKYIAQAVIRQIEIDKAVIE